jgi:type IV pilus assembly protein PilA
MLCNRCGQPLPENSQFCASCGEAVPMPPTIATAPPETSGMAIGSLVSGIFSFFLPAAIAAIVLGHIARSNIRKGAGRLTGNGIALAGLILGYIGLAFIPVILIIAAIAIPNLLRARIAANESSAVSSIRVIAAAEARYAASHRDAGYTCSLSDLREDIDDRLAAGQKNGYVFEFIRCEADAPGSPNVRYTIVATPMTPNETGALVYCSDETANVHSSRSTEGCLKRGKEAQ